MTSVLVKYEAACRALADAKAVDEVKDIRDKAEAMRAYAHQAKNRELEVDAAEIRMRAERRLGELIRAQKEGPGLATGGGDTSGGSRKAPPQEPPTLAQAGIDKKLSSRAQKLAAVPEDQFEGMIGEWRERVGKENERVTTNLLKAGERERRDSGLETATQPWPEGRYPVIYADPPWRYEHPPVGDTSRSIENQYPTMTIEEICALPIADIAMEDSVLFLWATAPKLAECFEVITAWGFTYRTCMVWVKDKIGMGYYVRNRHELLLIAKRGTLPTPAPSDRVGSVVEAPRLAHSAKPPAFYEIIEKGYPGLPKIELFCRIPREGWAAWGNEAEAA